MNISKFIQKLSKILKIFLMDKQLEYLYLSPLHINDISQRLKGVTLLKDHILSTVKSFQQYSDAVTQLITCMKKISASIGSYPEFSEDRTINSISALLLNFSENFSLHSTHIQCIITKLKEFAQKEVADAEDKGKKAKRDIEAYFKATENYASLSKKKPQMTQEEANSRLKSQHWNAVLSDFQYQRALELVDRQKSPEIAAQVCSFSKKKSNVNCLKKKKKN